MGYIGRLAFSFLFLIIATAASSEDTTDQQTIWWQKYMDAMKYMGSEVELACKNFTELAMEPGFPLVDLSTIRARQACGPNPVQPVFYDYRPFKQKPWLWPLALDVVLAEAIKNNDHALLSDIYQEKSKLVLLPVEKVDLTEKAIFHARKAKLPPATLRALNQRLYSLAPRKKKYPAFAELLPTAADYRRARDFNKALNFYNKVYKHHKSSLDEKYQALTGIRTTQKLAEDKPKFLKSCDAVVKFCLEKSKIKRNKSVREKFLKRYYDSLIVMARAYWTEGKVKTAIKTLERAERELKNKMQISDVYWLRGRIEDEKKNYTKATAWLEKAEKECKDDCVLKEKIVWNLAWSQIKLKQFSGAITRLDHAYEIAENPFAKPKFKFWRGKALQSLDKTEDSKKVFEELTHEDPAGYYGFLAFRELGNDIPQPAKYVNAASESDALKIEDTFSSTPGGKYAYWLISVGEYEAAGEYLDEQFDQASDELSKDITRLMDFLNAYARSNNYLKLFARLAEVPNNIRNQILSLAPAMAFPQPYNEDVKAAADKFGIKPELIYAIMRQESSFNPLARSPADAFGLMQLVPRMAHEAAKHAKVKFKADTDLYDPKVNIPLGTAYLKALWQKYQGQLVLVSASYNASEKAIRTWIDTRYFDEPLYFIEDVPYEETQNYIKLVLRNFIYYSSLNASTASFKFPDWALENLSDFRTAKNHKKSKRNVASQKAANSKNN